MTEAKDITINSINVVLDLFEDYKQLRPVEFAKLKKEIMDSVKNYQEDYKFIVEQFLNACTTARYNY